MSLEPDFDSVRSEVVEDFDGSSLRAFKGCHLGERCFILGNGPSLRNTDLAPLADEITFGVNGIFYMTWECGFTPTYYVVEDNHVIADNLARIRNVEAVAKFFPSKYRPVIEESSDTYFLPTDYSFYWKNSGWYETPRFSHDISEVVFAGQTVTFLNVQIAAYMGCREIYLVGVDYEYKIPEQAQIDGLTITSVGDDPNHFHPDYFGTGKKWHLPKLDNVGRAMICAGDGAREVGATVFNATIGGKLEVFPRRDFHELVRRPALAHPNTSASYLVARALVRAADLGARSVFVEPDAATSTVEAIVSASPLQLTAHEDADVVLASGLPSGGRATPDLRRVLVLPGDGVLDPDSDPNWVADLIVDRIASEPAAFWTRSLLELSPDGESMLVPALGRTAQRAVDVLMEFGLDEIGKLDESSVTRWALGRSMSIDRIRGLAREIVEHDHSFGVVDGCVYVQSRWKATESAADRLVRRCTEQRRPVIESRS